MDGMNTIPAWAEKYLSSPQKYTAEEIEASKLGTLIPRTPKREILTLKKVKNAKG